MTDNGFEKMNIQWFPGHMTKAGRMIEENVKLVDAVCELLDARIPMSSRNPDIDRLAGGKPRLVILNRVDLADPAVTAKWRAEEHQAHGTGRPRLRLLQPDQDPQLRYHLAQRADGPAYEKRTQQVAPDWRASTGANSSESEAKTLCSCPG